MYQASVTGVFAGIRAAPSFVERHRTDILIALVLMVIVGYTAWWATGLQQHVQTLIDKRADDVWFEADIARVYNDMSNRLANHYRTSVHPLFPLLTRPLVGLAQAVLRLDKMSAVRVVIGAAAGLWITLFYVLFRLLRCERLDSVVLALVAATSAGALYWLTIPETYEFGSITILGVLILAVIAERNEIPPWVEVAVCAASMSVLVTNFMVGLASLISRYKLRSVLQITSNALVVVVLLWTLQKMFFPSAQFFLGGHETVGGPVPKSTALEVIFLHSMVAPDTWNLPAEEAGLWPKLSLQHGALGRLELLTGLAIASWVCLLLCAIWALWHVHQYSRIRMVLVLSIAGQVALHLLYGNETFLYALDWIPLFVTAVALATLTYRRWVVLSFAALFVVTAGLHNALELKATLALLAKHAV